MGDGVLAMFTHEDIGLARRAALQAEHRFRRNMATLNVRRSAEGRATTSAYVGLHVGEVFYGNIGSEDRLDFTVVEPLGAPRICTPSIPILPQASRWPAATHAIWRIRLN